MDAKSLLLEVLRLMITTFSLLGCLFSGLWLSANFKPRSTCAFIPFRVLAFCPESNGLAIFTYVDAPAASLQGI
jgi:hypothetical protein